MTRRGAGVVAVAVAAVLGGCAIAPPAPRGVAGGTAPPAPGTVRCTYRPGGTPARPVDPPDGRAVAATGTTTLTLTLTGRPVQVELDRAAAPCAVASFESLAAQGFYTDTECHRLSTTSMFILQCGDPTGTGRGGPGYTFDDELDAVTGYPAGVLAMANAGPHTNGSQFFLVYADSPLPREYTVFGRTDAAGIEVVADLAHQGHDGAFGATGRPLAGAPLTAVVSG